MHRLKVRRVRGRVPWHPRRMTNVLPVALRRDRCLPRKRPGAQAAWVRRARCASHNSPPRNHAGFDIAFRLAPARLAGVQPVNPRWVVVRKRRRMDPARGLVMRGDSSPPAGKDAAAHAVHCSDPRSSSGVRETQAASFTHADAVRAGRCLDGQSHPRAPAHRAHHSCGGERRQ